MTDQSETALRTRLYDALDKAHVGMLGLSTSGDHPQPMTHHLNRESACLWFISHRDSALVQSLGQTGQPARFTMQDGGNTYASITGDLMQVSNAKKLDDLWSPMASAWFEGGQDDPKVVLLRMPLLEAEVWTIDANRLALGMEIARGTMGSHEPDVGTHAVLSFPEAA